MRKSAACILVSLGLTLALSACRPAAARVATANRPPTSTVTPTTTATELEAWHGPVAHLFFHTLIIRPELAFKSDALGQGFRDYFVTVGEFRAILAALYDRGWTLVDVHRAVAGTVMVPVGRRPLVLSEDDVNYYDYSRPRGLGWRLVLTGDGSVKVEVRDDQGTRVTDEDLVPLVDQFVARHPLFSADGAKGVLALTGYEGLFGERTDDQTAPDWLTSVARAKAIADRLRATGWTFASHSYGHIDLTKDSTQWAEHDTIRWLAEATPILGPTDVYVYPFGAQPPLGGSTMRMLSRYGFTIQCSIDPVPRLTHAGGVVVMTRRHVDGIAFAQQRSGLAPFFDVGAVEDVVARA